MNPSVAAALHNASVAWLAVPGQPFAAVWLLRHDGATYVVHGPGEQTAPGLSEAGRCRVIVRPAGADGAAVAVDAEVHTVWPDSAEWDAVVPYLAVKRLNAADPARTVERWRQACTVSRLEPNAGRRTVPQAAPATAPVRAAVAAPPPRSPATAEHGVPTALAHLRRA
jgi:hypothetical protein